MQHQLITWMDGLLLISRRACTVKRTQRLIISLLHPTDGTTHCLSFLPRLVCTQVEPAVSELRASLGELLGRRRAGVVAALVAACGRAGCCHKEVCDSLAAGLLASPQWAGQPGAALCACLLVAAVEGVLCVCVCVWRGEGVRTPIMTPARAMC